MASQLELQYSIIKEAAKIRRIVLYMGLPKTLGRLQLTAMLLLLFERIYTEPCAG
jgi:hypothetical protein